MRRCGTSFAIEPNQFRVVVFLFSISRVNVNCGAKGTMEDTTDAVEGDMEEAEDTNECEAMVWCVLGMCFR